MPLIISESLRSAVVSANSTQSIVTILLSSADLAKLDLSNLQLFTNDSFDLSKHQATEPPVLSCTQDTDAAKLALGNCNFSDKLANGDREVVLHSPALASERNVADDEFSFQTSVILSPAAELTPGGISFPIFKSRAVADAEKASSSQQSLSIGEISPPSRRKEVVLMNEYTTERQIDGYSSDDLTTSLNYIGMRSAGSGRSDKVRPGAPLPALVVPRAGLEDTPEKAEATLREVSEESMIDLKASPAAKFLLQVMPWELAPSPCTAANTPT